MMEPQLKFFAFAIVLSLLFAGCATGQGDNDSAGQALSGILAGVGDGLSGL